MKRFGVLVVLVLLGCAKEQIVQAPIIVEISPSTLSVKQPEVTLESKKDRTQTLAYGVQYSLPRDWEVMSEKFSLETRVTLRHQVHEAQVLIRIVRPDHVVSPNVILGERLLDAGSRISQRGWEQIESVINASVGRAYIRYRFHDTYESYSGRFTHVASLQNHHMYVVLDGYWPTSADVQCNDTMNNLELSIQIPHEK